MIEKDLKIIRKNQVATRSKTAQELKNLSRRQTLHEKQNTKQFQTITTAISNLPTKELIAKSITKGIKTNVNGKIDALKIDVATTNNKADLIGEHLKRQDLALEALSVKIRPIDGVRVWLSDAGKVILYIGAIALALVGIIKLLSILGVKI